MNFAEGRDDKIAELNRILSRGGVVLFTGAGFSVPSGIPDFRIRAEFTIRRRAAEARNICCRTNALSNTPTSFSRFTKQK